MLAPTVTLISALLALGVITPFNKGDALADSQSRTLQAGTSKMRIDVRAPADRVEYTATGAYDYREDRGVFSYNFTKMDNLDGAAAVEARYVQSSVFIRLPDPPLPRRPWLLVDMVDDPKLEASLRGSDAPGELANIPDLQIQDPTAVLAAMDRSGDVEYKGSDRQFGVKLRKYSGRIPAGAGRPPTTATAWLGDDDLIRRLALEAPGGRSTTMSFYDFGTEVDTSVPPPEEVVVYSESLLAAAQ